MYRLEFVQNLKKIEAAFTKRRSYFNTSTIVFDYDVCPTLILAVILGEVLRFAVGVHIYVHNRHLYMSIVESHLYVEAFKTRYVLAELQTNQAGWLFIAHKGFSARMFGNQRP